VDIGEDLPVRCIKNALWVLDYADSPCAIVLSETENFRCGVTEILIEVAVLPGSTGADLATQFFARLEEAISRAGSYRGKVLSMEKSFAYSGMSGGILVHKLPPIERDQIILPERTLALLERNVFEFFEARDQLAAAGMSTKKGLLFYGAPGTGKTHSIHYLSNRLQDHTTLIITAEQIQFLPEYMTLARLLQPSIVVLEDADLLARERTSMHFPVEEVLLNQLLNEMDGLREDAEILFILTTNRPETLEAALTSRPGRIDQAIEFPLPDDEDRRRLIKLYAGGLTVPEAVSDAIVARTDKVSAAFIKELMRRAAQFCFARGDDGRLEQPDISDALDEMLVSGGRLNISLLGGNLDAAVAEGTA
jgi:predicted AAA+ superfamily ATPase